LGHVSDDRRDADAGVGDLLAGAGDLTESGGEAYGEEYTVSAMTKRLVEGIMV